MKLDYPRWKKICIIMTCLFFALLAFPNVLNEEQRAHMPGWMPQRTVNLGLDLQGGVHFLMKVDFNVYLAEHMQSVMDGVRMQLRDAHVKYAGLSVREGKIIFSLREGQPDININSLIHKVDADLRILSDQNKSYAISYDDAGLSKLKRSVLDKSIEIVERRVNETGTREPIVQRQGEDRILLQVPGLRDPEALKALLGKTARMTFHLVDANASGSAILPPDVKRLPMREHDAKNSGAVSKLAIKRRALLTGDLLIDAGVTQDNMGQPAVSFRFNAIGSKRFGEATTQNVGQPFAIVLDDEIITAPRINEPILGGSGIISGSFSPQEAADLALLLRSGSLPAPLSIMEERSVGPSLGADSIKAGTTAALAGIGFVMFFMAISYGLFGIFANVAVLLNMVILMGSLSLFQATLTLPGIAGIVLTVGMAVDANVLIYERLREEISKGRTPMSAVGSAFEMAFGTIFDSNITTLIAAVLLYYYGSGTVKGFAVTLSIGILSSMFTSVMITKMLVVNWLLRKKPKRLPI